MPGSNIQPLDKETASLGVSTCLHAALSFPFSFVCFGLRLFYVGGGVRFPSFCRCGDPPCLALVEAPLGGVHEVLALLSSRGLIGVVHSWLYQSGRLGVVAPCPKLPL